MKKITKQVTEKQAYAILRKFNPDITIDLSEVGHGDFMFMIRNDEKGTETFYIMKRIHLTKFNLAYSLNDKVKSGKELIISNVEIPRSAKKLLPR